MFDELETAILPGTITVGQDLSTMSVSDIDERIEQFEHEIARLKEERARKANSIDQAESFFKKSD